MSRLHTGVLRQRRRPPRGRVRSWPRRSKTGGGTCGRWPRSRSGWGWNSDRAGSVTIADHGGTGRRVAQVSVCGLPRGGVWRTVVGVCLSVVCGAGEVAEPAVRRIGLRLVFPPTAITQTIPRSYCPASWNPQWIGVVGIRTPSKKSYVEAMGVLASDWRRYGTCWRGPPTEECQRRFSGRCEHGVAVDGVAWILKRDVRKSATELMAKPKP